MILTKVRMHVRPLARHGGPKRKTLNCARLSSSDNHNNFCRSLAVKLADIEQLISSESGMEEKWTSLSTILFDTAAQAVGFKTKKHQDWFDQNAREISTLLDRMHKAHRATLNNPQSQSHKKLWQALRSEAQTTLRTLQDEWWISKANEIQTHADRSDMHSFYDAVKTIYGPRNCSLAPVRSVDGTSLIRDQAMIVERWAEHFNTLLNQPTPVDPTVLAELPEHPTMPDLDLPPTFKEILHAVKTLINNKSPGPDSIPAELLKEGGYLCTRTLHRYISEVWRQECVPQQWKDANIVTIYKNKGDKSVCSNSRGISLLATAGKVLAKVMLRRLISTISERVTPESQCGFRKDRGTVDMIFVTRQLQEKCREQHKDLFIAFVDLSKAFDTVNRDVLWQVLKRFGCPPKFLNILAQFHSGMMARVVVGRHSSEPFGVETGVRQGCVLAPVLFNIFLVCVTTLLRRRMEKQAGVTIDFRLDGNLFNIRRLQATTKMTSETIIELQYADDCALVAHTPEALQNILSAAVNAYTRMGLTINTQKTEVLCQSSADLPPNPITLTAAGQQLLTVPTFKYLGSIVSDTCSLDDEIQNRLKQASASFGRLRRRVFENSNLRLHTKMLVYRAVCITTLLYGCEALTIYSRHLRSLETFHVRCLQKILGITWRDRVPHILERAGSCSMESIMTQHQLRWLGHVIRMPSHRLPRRILYGQLHLGQRSAGGQKKRFKDHMKNTLKRCRMNPSSLEELASCRVLWRSHCSQGVHYMEEQRTQNRAAKRAKRHARQATPAPPSTSLTCPVCNRICGSRIGLFKHQQTHK